MSDRPDNTNNKPTYNPYFPPYWPLPTNTANCIIPGVKKNRFVPGLDPIKEE